MPLVGLIDPRGSDALPHPGTLPPWVTTEQLLRVLERSELGDSHWTYEMAAAAIANVQDRGDMISTTAITTSCMRGEVLKRKEDYVGDLDELHAALRGTLIHRSLELSANPNSIAEVRFFTTVDGIEISGAPDLLTPKSLIDYKVPADQNSVPFTYLYTNQTEQLMINAFICRNAEKWEDADGNAAKLPFDPRQVLPESVGIVFIGPKRPKVMVSKKSTDVIGANGKPKKARIPYIWSDEEVLKAIRPRLHLLKNALESYPEWPESWTDPDTGETYQAEDIWGGDQTWNCPGYPACKYTTCLAKRSPGMYAW